MGKSSINESLENYQGMYFGAYSDEGIRPAVEESDLVLYMGPIRAI